MNSLRDWLEVLGYLLLLGAILYGLYLLLPKAPAPETPPGEGAREPGAQPGTPEPAKGPSMLDWARLADEHEGYAVGHAERVAALALRLADAVGLPPAERAVLEKAALLHDVGEIDFEPELLLKPGPLSRPELFRLWEHAARGARKAYEITGDAAVSQWVRWHHESWDGLGYPDGLAGDEIPLPARMLRLADSAVAMLAPRPYRGALSPEETLGEISRLAGTAFDPALAVVFADEVLPAYLAEHEGRMR